MFIDVQMDNRPRFVTDFSLWNLFLCNKSQSMKYFESASNFTRCSAWYVYLIWIDRFGWFSLVTCLFSLAGYIKWFLSRSLRIKRELRTWTQNVNAEHELRTWTQIMNAERELRTWSQNVNAERELRTWTQNANSGHKPRTWTQNLNSERELRTWTGSLNFNLNWEPKLRAWSENLNWEPELQSKSVQDTYVKIQWKRILKVRKILT